LSCSDQAAKQELRHVKEPQEDLGTT
jgi:hypothetical protein